MADLNWTSEAERWLHDIYHYIAEDNPAAAISVIEGIYQKVQLLRNHPFLGYRHEDWPELEIRILLYGHYRIAYVVRTNEDIDIIGVFHGAMEIGRYLKR